MRVGDFTKEFKSKYLLDILNNIIRQSDEEFQARLIRSHSSARFSFEISEIRINSAFQTIRSEKNI